MTFRRCPRCGRLFSTTIPVFARSGLTCGCGAFSTRAGKVPDGSRVIDCWTPGCGDFRLEIVPSWE